MPLFRSSAGLGRDSRGRDENARRGREAAGAKVLLSFIKNNKKYFFHRIVDLKKILK
jgi:hypothetical protein